MDETPKPLWPSSPPAVTLPADAVHLWCAALDQPTPIFQQFIAALSADEREKAGRFRFDKHRRHFIAGRGFLRTVLSDYLNVEPAAIQLIYGHRGKPALAGEQADGLRFNLSHSGGLALLGVTLGRDIGVDIEHIRPMNDLLQVAQRFFSPREAAVLQAIPPDQHADAFFNCWTRKEATIKAWGDGLYRPLDTFDVTLIPNEPARLLYVKDNPQEVERWSLHDLRPAVGYAAAVIAEGHDLHLECWRW